MNFYYIIDNIPMEFATEIDPNAFFGRQFLQITQEQFTGLRSGILRFNGTHVETIPEPAPPSAAELLQQAKNQKRQENENHFNQSAQNFEFNDGTKTVAFDMTPGGRTWNEFVAQQAGVSTLPDTVPVPTWVGKNGFFSGKNVGQWKQFYGAAMQWYGTLASLRAQKNLEIESATTVEQVNAIIIS